MRARGCSSLLVTAFLVGACVGQVVDARDDADLNAGGSGAPPPGGGGGAFDPSTPVNPAALDPGRVTLRRLNRTEYNNTVRDLLGTPLRPADDFTPDVAGAFDNDADVQSLKPLQVDLYEKAAERLVEDLFANAPSRAAAREVLICDVTAGGRTCLESIVVAFAKRAFRRPAAADELARLLALAESAGSDPTARLKLALRGILAAPQFLFLVELDPDPASPAPHPLGPYELGARLSYFLWSSLPDAELMAAADAGRLTDPATLRAQVERMLADPKAAALADALTGQWLATRTLASTTPSKTVFPEYDAALGAAFAAETRLFVTEFLRGDHGLEKLLTADFTFANERLARHYGVTVSGAAFARIPAPAGRAGLLGQAAILTVNSTPERSNIPRRGRYVLERFMCTPPPPPPPDVDELPAVESGGETVRERLAAHASGPTCVGCHQVVDPIGFGLEHFDAIGRWRDREITTSGRQIPVDASGVMPDGTRFDGAVELTRILAADPRFPACVTRNLLGYALGRSLRPTDQPYVDRILARQGGVAATLKNVLFEVVASDPFRMRRGEAP